MKESKAVYVTKHKILDDQNLIGQIYANQEYTTENKDDTSNFGCQYDNKRDNLICTCKPKRPNMRYFSGSPKQIYAYHGSRSFTDVGVGSVKALQRRKVKRVYLPETDDRGVGSSDLSPFITRKTKKQKSSFYDHKRTSSKCVGGFPEYSSCISQKLSPIVQTKSGSTSPNISFVQYNVEIGSSTVERSVITTGTQFEIENKGSKRIIVQNVGKDMESKKPVENISEQTQKFKGSDKIQGKKMSVMERKAKCVDKVFSSDSLVQHVHNLENPSDDKQSRASIDPMENKLEREYRRMFTTKDRDSKSSVGKPIPAYKSASILRRRFEALRKGLKKDDGTKNNLSSQDSAPSRKDASVTSDPPSLEGRSFIDTKKYSPIQTNVENKTKVYKTERNSAQWPQSEIDSECQGVKGMFNLWGKKFKFEDDVEKPKTTPLPSLAIDIHKKPQKQMKEKPKEQAEPKKSGWKFSFFKKKSKDHKLDKPKKETEIYNPSGVTAGRCEISDGLIIKIGNLTPKETISRISEEGGSIHRKTWLKNFLASTITSARSVNVRWNNSMYATSSSTVFELMDTIYKNNGVVIKSRSEITSDESSYYRSYTKNKVNFDQNIEAWMVPKTIPYRPREIPVRIQSHREFDNRDLDMIITDHRWLIEKSKAFANKIEVVLLSKNFNRITNKASSEYLRIDIPKDFFDISSSDVSKQDHSSDEEVYKIVEYESDLNAKQALEKGDHASEIRVIVNVKDNINMEAKILETIIKKPPMHRDVVIQGSNVNIPKRCDVIGVGIITQRDLRDIRKPILKIQDEISDEDSEDEIQIKQKKCEFAESYLQEYYNNWTPMGTDLFSWCVSDSHLRSCSEKSLISFNNQGDGSRSCPNIFEDFQASTIVPSCNTSSCSQCCDETQKPEESFSSKLFKKFMHATKAKTDTDIAKRVLPKDSLEVFKRRKIYASSLKSRWASSEDRPVSVPSNESKGAQDTLDYLKIDKPICIPPKSRNEKKTCKKHVSMLDCDTPNEIPELQCDKKIEGILAFKGHSGCDVCKKKGVCAKHATVKAKPITEIPQPPCKVSCEKMKKPPCEKPGSPPCNLDPKQSPNMSPKQCKPPKCPATPTCCPKSPPRPASPRCPASPPCPASRSPASPPRHRRNANPNIKCGSAPCSPSSLKGSPNLSHHCLSSVRSPIPKKRCPQCQNPQPCKNFPNCKLSIESLKKRLDSPKLSPKASPPCRKASPPCQKANPPSPKASKKSPPSPCSPKASREGSPRKKPTKTSPCNLPPSNFIKKFSPASSPKSPCEQFPWPLKNQVSYPPSPVSSDTNQKKSKDKCKTKCSMLPNASNQSLPPKKECKPDCASRKKETASPREANKTPKSQICPENNLETCPTKRQQPCPAKSPPAKKSSIQISKQKISGLYLKMKPSKKERKTCSKECLAWASPDENGVFRLNSRENITISMKKDTPSTEEIRECMDIKVKDADENTLFERKDYTIGASGHKPSVLGDMYKDSKINRVSTPVMVVANDATENCLKHQDEVDNKSEASLTNLIEIQFNLRIMQGDKTTEISIANDDGEKQEKGIDVRNTEPEVFVLKNEEKEQEKHIDENPKNDINIKIVVKNYKPKYTRHKEVENDRKDVEFSKNISKKFHTVSTGYSDVITDPDDDNVFSVHRTTIDLDSVDDKSRTQSTSLVVNEMFSEDTTEPLNFMVSSHSTIHLATDVTEDDEKTITIKNNTLSEDVTNDDNKDLLSDQDMTIDLNTSKEYFELKYNAKDEKKQLLKKVFERAYTKPKTKENVRELTKSLKVILTDSSDNNEMNAISNELAKDVTYASLKPDFFRNTDSMNNYYKMDSYLTVEGSKRSAILPTEENNSNASSTSRNIKIQGCMCKQVAEKLNCDLKIGCCCRQRKIDEVTSCDIRNEQDIFLLNYRTDCIDVFTQNSNHLSNKSNSINLSIHNTVCAEVETDKVNIIENAINTNISTTKRDKCSTHSCTKYEKKLNQTIGISDKDTIVLVNQAAKTKTGLKLGNLLNASDVLQSYETKKAVLEIYAEKTRSENGEHLVVKLPKFFYEKESEITRNYEQIATNSYKSVCRRNVFRMSVG